MVVEKIAETCTSRLLLSRCYGRIDEYLFFIGSKDMINWLDKYSKFEDLKKEFIKSKSLVKWKYKEYTIIK